MNDPTQGYGKAMIYAAWIIALIGLTWFFSGLLDTRTNPNRQPEIRTQQNGTREVILQRNRKGHYIASGMINGEPVDFLLDTGATVVSIPADIAQRLRLQRGAEFQAETANGTVTVYSTVLNSISLGNITLRNVRASINPQMRETEILLGMSFLKQLEFTQREGVLILRQTP